MLSFTLDSSLPILRELDFTSITFSIDQYILILYDDCSFQSQFSDIGEDLMGLDEVRTQFCL